MTLVFDGNISATRDTNGKQSIIQAQDNPDVGIMIMDSQQNSVDLNALATSVGVPFRLVENRLLLRKLLMLLSQLYLLVQLEKCLRQVVIMHWLYCEWNISNF